MHTSSAVRTMSSVIVATLARVATMITRVTNCQLPLNFTVKITASMAVGIHA